MSDHTSHEHSDVRAEEDRVHSGTIVVVGVASLVVFFLASWVTVSYLFAERRARPGPPVPAEVGQNKIGMVEQQLFDLAVRGERQRAGQLDRLGAYGWVDRGAGVVHLPIDRAMDLVSRGVRPAPNAPPRPSDGGPQP